MEKKLFDKLKKITNKTRRRPVEDIHRSMDIVEFILHEAEDFGVVIPTVTYALRHMKENPNLDISDAIVLGYEDCNK
jgi:hypothetical protein